MDQLPLAVPLSDRCNQTANVHIMSRGVFSPSLLGGAPRDNQKPHEQASQSCPSCAGRQLRVCCKPIWIINLHPQLPLCFPAKIDLTITPGSKKIPVKGRETHGLLPAPASAQGAKLAPEKPHPALHRRLLLPALPALGFRVVFSLDYRC